MNTAIGVVCAASVVCRSAERLVSTGACGTVQPEDSSRLKERASAIRVFMGLSIQLETPLNGLSAFKRATGFGGHFVELTRGTVEKESTLQTDHMFVLTGGPGAGKTSLIEALRKRGFASTMEAGRAIIRERPLDPRCDPLSFAEAMLARELDSYRRAKALEELVFCDRGLPDVIGYLQLSGQPVPAHIDAAARTHRYNRRVFIAPHWPEIYRQDEERTQTSREARRTFQAMASAYRAYGYALEMLPRAGVAARVDFVLNRVGSSSK